VRELCHRARELLIEEGNVVTVTAPVTVSLSMDALDITRMGIDQSFSTIIRYAAISTANFMISWSYSALAAMFPTQIISLWV
jgi:hypothetical protein